MAQMTETALWGLVGWLVGVVLGGVARALPLGGEVWPPRCSACRSPLPVGLRLWLGLPWAGPCRSCGQTEGLGGPVLPALCAAIFAGLCLRLGVGPALFASSFAAAVLALVMYLDLLHRLVFGVVAYPAAALSAIALPLIRWPEAPWWSGMAGGAIGAGFFALAYALGRLLYRGEEPMGQGDILVGGLVGAVAGVKMVLPTLFAGVVLSGFLSLFYGLKSRSLRTYAPYGPGLCLAGLGALFW